MAKKNLAINLQEALEYIVGYGGYVTKNMLHSIRSDLQIDSCYRILKQLEDMEYLRNIEYFKEKQRGIVYQVTGKATRYCGRKDAHMRRKHDKIAQRMYLVRAHYLFDQASAGKGTQLFSSSDRHKFLNEFGFTDYYLPQKIYLSKDKKVNKIVQIDDFILEAFCKKRTITFVCVDNFRHKPISQLRYMFEKYHMMAKAQIAFIDFHVVTDSEERLEGFKNAYFSQFFSVIDMFDVKFNLINTSYEIEVFF